MTAPYATYPPTKREIVLNLTKDRLAFQDLLYAIEQRFTDEGLMFALEEFASFPNPYESDIERVVQQHGEPSETKFASPFVPQSSPFKFFKEGGQRISSRAIQLKSLDDKR